jgi:TonB-linked SusC/RagA family outer membrane protein
MYLFAFPQRERQRSVAAQKMFLSMKRLLIVLLALLSKASANSPTQEVTLSLTNVNLEVVFKEIQKQTEYRFVYTKEQLVQARKVSIDVKSVPVEVVLRQCFKEQPLTYTIEEKFIIVSFRDKLPETKTSQSDQIDITGKVLNEEDNGIPGASISVKGSNKGAATNAKGEFQLAGIDKNSILIISSIGYETKEVWVAGQVNLVVQLKMAPGNLDETVVIAYGTTTKKLNTGSVGKITSAEIEKQPVTNPLAALEGRVPGLIVTQTSGIPGGSFKLQIRGQNSLAQGNDALIVIDGVPFAPNNNRVNQVTGAFTFNNNGLSPLNSVNPNDIESIEVLKDADATAIYGSRGANGVILISTKKGKPGKTRVNLTSYTGVGKISRYMDLLNTQQYLTMRREAFSNDGVAMTNSNAYDLLLWDTTRYTDFKKLLIGGNAYISDAQVSISGGSADTKFLVSAGYHHESTVYPGNSGDKRRSFHFNINHHAPDKKLSLILTGSYWSESNNIITNDLTSSVISIPNLPVLYDSTGKLNWSDKGFSFNNPLAMLLLKYRAEVNNFLVNLQLNYRVTNQLTFKINTGYNYFDVDEMRINPIAAQDPANSPTGSSAFGASNYKNVIIEPQSEYVQTIGKGSLTALAGFSWQQNIFNSTSTNASGYVNDALLESLAGASSITATSNSSQYRYAAVFGRLNYNLHNKYLLNITGRRDGSSRFGPGKQFANFGSIGAAWIFFQEKFLKKFSSFLSYGKLRTSYGSSGNDAIGDYQFLDTWSATSLPYQGNAGLSPTGLFNPDYSWEVNRKFESAIDLGFSNDRILISVSYFRNRSSNQLVSYPLPTQTGFSSVIKNFPALVQNAGLEGELLVVPFKSKDFNWSCSFNITSAKNKLLRFEGLSTSSYRTKYLIGRPLNIVSGFEVIGIDPATGRYQFLGNDGTIKTLPSSATDLKVGLLNLDPDYYGGVKNSFSYKTIQLDIFLEYRKQTGASYLTGIGAVPGTRFNQPALVLDRWQRPGQQTNIIQFTQGTVNPTFQPVVLINAFGSNVQFTDASFIRLKNLSLSYSLPQRFITKMKIERLRFYVQGQNLFVITKYKGADPETQTFNRLPPLRFFTGGFQFTF